MTAPDQIRFRRILVANRGEIALRIIRACHELGIEAVAVWSDADRSALFVRHADEAVRVGESEPLRSYLDQDAIFAAARLARVDAIHPGYGFLSENADFARRCRVEGFAFIGPLSGDPELPSWRFLALMGVIGGAPTFVGTVIGYEPLVEGFLPGGAAGGRGATTAATGRPVDVLQLADGSIVISDDRANHSCPDGRLENGCVVAGKMGGRHGTSPVATCTMTRYDPYTILTGNTR